MRATPVRPLIVLVACAALGSFSCAQAASTEDCTETDGLIVNGRFECGSTESWVAHMHNGGTFGVTTDAPYEGQYSGHALAGIGPEFGNYIEQWVTAASGQEYILTLALRCQTGRARIQVLYLDGATGYPNLDSIVTPSPGIWQPYSLGFTTKGATLEVFVEFPAGTTSDIDAIALMPAETPTRAVGWGRIKQLYR